MAPLYGAAMDNNLKKARKLLRKGANVNVRYSGVTPLHAAAQKGHAQMATFLLDHGAEVDAETPRDATPLHFAAQCGSRAVVVVLVERGANLEARDDCGKTPLVLAAGADKVGALEELLDRGADMNTKIHADRHVGAPECDLLLYALDQKRGGHSAAARMLLARGYPVDTDAAGKLSPLGPIAREGDLELARDLLARGVPAEHPRALGPTALYVAALVHHVEMATLLLEHGADAASNPEILYEACFGDQGRAPGCAPLVALLLTHGAAKHVNHVHRNHQGAFCLWMAAQTGSADVTRLLIDDAGADVSLKMESNGCTALDVALFQGHKDVAALLKAAGAETTRDHPNDEDEDDEEEEVDDGEDNEHDLADQARKHFKAAKAASAPPKPPPVQLTPQAEALKSSGNALFKQKKFRAAVAKYTKAIALAPGSHVLLSNRSAAFAHCGAHEQALGDARACLQRCPRAFEAKAHHRVFIALRGLQRHTAALEALGDACDAAPDNKEYATQLEQYEEESERRTARQRSLAKPGAHANVTDHGQLPGWKNVERRLAAMGVTATFGPPPYEQIQWHESRTPAFPKPMSRAEQMWTAHGQWLSGVKNAHRAKRTRSPNFDPKNPRWSITGLFTTLESLTNAVLMDRKCLVLDEDGRDGEAFQLSLEFQFRTRGAILPFDKSATATVEAYRERLAAGAKWDVMMPALAVTLRGQFFNAFMANQRGYCGDALPELKKAVDILVLARETLDPGKPLAVRGNTLQPSIERNMRVEILECLLKLVSDDETSREARRGWAGELKAQAEKILESSVEHPWHGGLAGEMAPNTRAFHFWPLAKAHAALGYYHGSLDETPAPATEAEVAIGQATEAAEDHEVHMSGYFVAKVMAADHYAAAVRNLPDDDPNKAQVLCAWGRELASAGGGTLGMFKMIATLYERTIAARAPIFGAATDAEEAGATFVRDIIQNVETMYAQGCYMDGTPLVSVYDVLPPNGVRRVYQPNLPMVHFGDDPASHTLANSPFHALPPEERPLIAMKFLQTDIKGPLPANCHEMSNGNRHAADTDDDDDEEEEEEAAGSAAAEEEEEDGDTKMKKKTKKDEKKKFSFAMGTVDDDAGGGGGGDESDEFFSADDGENDDDSPPEEFVDSITKDVMRDPVKLPTCDYVVDRSTIAEHLSQCALKRKATTCPFTRVAMSIDDVRPAAALKARIDAWRAARAARTEGGAVSEQEAAEDRELLENTRRSITGLKAKMDAVIALPSYDAVTHDDLCHEVNVNQLPDRLVPRFEALLAELHVAADNRGPGMVPCTVSYLVDIIPTMAQLRANAEAALADGRLETARDFFSVALAIEPGAQRLLGTGTSTGAVGVGGCAITQARDNVARHELFLLRARCHAALGARQSAAADAAACADLAPGQAERAAALLDDADAQREMRAVAAAAKVAANGGRPVLSDVDRRTAVKRLMDLGHRAAYFLQYESAAAAFRRVIELDPEHAPAHYHLGLAVPFFRAGQIYTNALLRGDGVTAPPCNAAEYATGRVHIHMATELDPSPTLAAQALCFDAEELMEIDGSVERQDSEHSVRTYQMGGSSEGADKEAAMAKIQEALEKDPNNLWALNTYGTHLRDKARDESGCRAVFQKVVTLTEDIATGNVPASRLNAMIQRANALANLGARYAIGSSRDPPTDNLDDAVRCWEQVLVMNPPAPPIRQLGVVLPNLRRAYQMKGEMAKYTTLETKRMLGEYDGTQRALVKAFQEEFPKEMAAIETILSRD